MNSLIIEGLNMKALNALVWASAVLAKSSVVVMALVIVFYILMIIVSVLE